MPPLYKPLQAITTATVRQTALKDQITVYLLTLKSIWLLLALGPIVDHQPKALSVTIIPVVARGLLHDSFPLVAFTSHQFPKKSKIKTPY